MKPNLEFLRRERLEELLLESRTRKLSGVERQELNSILRADEAARALAAQTLMDDAALAEELRSEQMEALLAADSGGMLGAAQHSPEAKQRRWMQWRPLTAAAAGVMLGLLCASLAWAVATPRAMATAERLFALVDGGFEDGAVSAGFPKQLGGWSGDASEIVVAEGVKTREGRRMLRFVKAEGDANAPDGRAISCDVFQLVDLRPLRGNLGADGDSLLELSASFLDARPGNTKPSVTFFCQIFLFKGDATSLHQSWPGNISEAIASGSAQVTTLGGNGEAWKQLTAKSLVSAEADFAVVQISARPNLRVPMPSQLFVDDVKLTLKTQPTLTVRVVQR